MTDRSEWDEENQVLSKKPLHNWASNLADAFRSFLARATNKRPTLFRKRSTQETIWKGRREQDGWEDKVNCGIRIFRGQERVCLMPQGHIGSHYSYIFGNWEDDPEGETRTICGKRRYDLLTDNDLFCILDAKHDGSCCFQKTVGNTTISCVPGG